MAVDLKGQGDAEGGAHALPAGEGDLAAHGLYQTLHDGQAQPRALIAGAGIVGLLHEGLEDVLLKLLAHADAVIGAGELVDGAVAVGGERAAGEPDAAAAAAILDGVAHQIHQDLAEVGGTADETGRVIGVPQALHGVGDAVLGGVGLVGDADLIQNVRQSEGLMLQLELAAFQLAHI